MMMMINVALIIIKRCVLFWSFYSERETLFLFSWLSFVTFYLGFFTNPKQNWRSFLLPLLEKPRPARHTHSLLYNRESSSNAMKTTTTTTSVTSRASLLPSQSSSSNEQKRVVARKLKVTLLFLLCFCVHITSLSFEFPLAKNSLEASHARNSTTEREEELFV